MVVAARRTLTWGTVAAAVVSALLLACAGSNLPRLIGAAGDALSTSSLRTVRPGLTGQRPAGASDVDRSAAGDRANAAHRH